jgi:hypothetical protein
MMVGAPSSNVEEAAEAEKNQNGKTKEELGTRLQFSETLTEM